MPSIQLQKITRGKLWKFFGGIKPNELKNTTASQIEELKLPSLICLPIEKHLGTDGEILVNVGDRVKKGQQLTQTRGRLVPVHASTSGTITSIGAETLPHPSGYTGLCITIKPDGLDEAVEYLPMKNWEMADNKEILDKIHMCGVEGLGGAQFQTDAKLKSALEESTNGTNVLIINGCECEPAITCDDRLMQENATEIALGIRILKKILNPKITLVAIEDNKPEAIKAMKQACESIATVRVIPTLYPSGAARNLIKILTGIEIPYNAHTSECGVVVNNVSTTFAVKEAVVDGKPLISRIVTMTGKSLKHEGNVRVRLGTSVRFLLSNFGLNPEYQQRIIMGGPMMGFTLPTIDVPITKSVNCILAPTTSEIPKIKEPLSCIRCGRCARVCPSRLVPYLMYKQSKAQNHAAAQKCGIKDCTLCGSCAFVCPSAIPLTSQFRYEKAVEAHIADAERRNLRAKQRMDAHNERLEQERIAREKKKAEALARIQAQKEAEAKMTPEELAAARQKAIEEAKEKAKQRKAQLLAQKSNDTKTPSQDESEAINVKRLQDTKQKQIEIAKHQGNINTLKTETSIEEKILNAQSEEEKNILPYNLQKQSALRDEIFIAKPFAKPVEVTKEPILVGLEPNDNLQNPPQKKVIPQVLLSHELEKDVKKNILPEALKKKTLRTKH